MFNFFFFFFTILNRVQFYPFKKKNIIFNNIEEIYLWSMNTSENNHQLK